ncbi:unnamed protein product [Ectocarpus sp. 13 AM-2016]
MRWRGTTLAMITWSGLPFKRSTPTGSRSTGWFPPSYRPLPRRRSRTSARTAHTGPCRWPWSTSASTSRRRAC